MIVLCDIKQVKHIKSRRSPEIAFMHSESLLILRGAERWLLEVSKYLSLRGFKVLMITSSSPLDEYSSIKVSERYGLIKTYFRNCRNAVHVELNVLSYMHIPKALSPIARFLRHSGIVVPVSIGKLLSLVRAVRGCRFVYVVIGDAFQAVASCILVILLGGRKVVLGLHSRPSYRRFLYARHFLEALSMLGVLKAIHTVNSVDALILRQMFKNVNVLYIPNGVDCEKFRPDVERNKENVFQVLFVGSLSEDKGVDIVLQVAKKLKTKWPVAKVKVVIASVGGSLEHQVREAAKRGFIEYRGFVDNDMLAELYAASHIVLLPSRDEAFGLTALEAQACGTPVICSSVSGFRQTVINNSTGLLVSNHGGPESFMEATCHLYRLWISSRKEYYEMCLNARRHVQNRFCWDNVISRLVCPVSYR